MQPSEPEQPGTSLDLTFPERNADVAPAGTSLQLPPSDPPPMPPAVAGEPAAASDPAPGPLGDLVVAHFRRVEVAMLGRVLVATLSGALPPSMVRVEHHRSFGSRLRGRSGEAVGVTVTAGERELRFRAPEVGVVETTIAQVVRGVVLATTPVTVPVWLDALGEVLQQVTRDDEATRAALERALTR